MPFDRISRSLNASTSNVSQAASISLIQANSIANKQKQCHISIGGAPSNMKSTQGDNKTSNQSFFRWIQPTVK